MNLSSIGSASSVTSGFLSEPPLSPGPGPVPAAAPIPQLRTVDSTPAAESLSGSEPQAPVTPLVPAPAPAPAPQPIVSGSEPQSPPAAPPEAPVAPAESPSLESTLLRMRLVTPDQIASAMREEAETGRPIAEIVVANGWVSADDLARLQNTAPAPAAVVAPPPEPVVAAPAPPPPVADPTPQPVVQEVAPAPAPAAAAAPAPAPAPAPVQVAPRADVGARIFVRLENGERIEVGDFDGFEAAKKRAREL